ncbi:MAG: long-chain fatty acid--CoA ligase, partial [Cyclobacteriaceae bacterium]|nr:long-chain fatty acid--CoA ligase [Cyclobacteriaceae bacterium]
MEVTRTFDLLDRYNALFPDKEDALAGKVKGQWKKYSSREYIENANLISYGLMALGLKSGDRIATISNNRPEWNFMDMGMAQLGIVQVPLFTTLDAAGYQRIMEHAEVKLAVVSDQSLFNKIKGFAGEISLLEKIYTFDEVDGAPHWKEIRDLGSQNKEKYTNELLAIKKEIKPTDCVSLIYTSGTTGNSKGVLLSHQNLVSNGKAVAGVFQLQPGHRYLSILPICHVGERMAIYQTQYSGCSLYYGENLGTIATDLQDIKPQGFGAVPRILEKVYDKIVLKGQKLTGIKKKLFFWALNLGLKYKAHGENGLWYECQLFLARKIIFSKWQAALGGNIISIGVGGAALQPRLERVFWAAGIKLLNMYGLTETSPVITINRATAPNLMLGTVGSVIEGVELKLADDGEILCKGPNVMLGYYKDEQATAEAIDPEGWFHTGDIGKLEDGKFLKITDRKKEIFKLSNGKYVSPLAVENIFKESLYIDQLMVIGDGEKFAGALISPSMDNL